MNPPATAPDPTGLAEAYPPHALRDYAVLADGYRGALLGPRGDVAWLCVPRWDSAAVFSALIGGPGTYGVTPADRFVWGGFYEPGTMIWRSRWMTDAGAIECREALAYPGEPGRAVLLRRIVAGDQPAVVDVTLNLAPDFGRTGKVTIERDDTGRWSLRAGVIRARWSGAAEAQHRHGCLRLRLEVPADGHHDLVLEIAESELGEPVDPDRAWHATGAAWSAAVPDFAATAAPTESRQSYAVMRGLTAPGGGTVAAATLGLPERAQAGRNYDYRYVWLRDQAYVGIAAGVRQPLPLLDEAVAHTTARVLEHGDRLAPAYRLDGRLPPREATLDLPGYPGGRDVVGNWVRGQFQLDSLGEILQLCATSGRHDHLSTDDRAAAKQVIDLIEQRWPQPDAGVWEVEQAWWTHSRLACVAGLRAVAGSLDHDQAARAATLADQIMAETSRRCLGADGAWRQRPDRPGVDAALLLPPVRGALPATDPRSLATLDKVGRDLVRDGYVYRYAVDQRPLGDAEGAFSMCGFALSIAQLAAGRRVDAYRSFDRQLTAAGTPGLFSEEFDIRQRQLRGNLPQVFVHALMLEASQRLAQGPP
ncbi:glycoside hydrolase family 15 protein [Microlunatus ginsengisoli]|uniref:Glycoside hydrolase family 15 protein n=1 Tax=Microlunatus ginsengisoli TaxID=363863 RepID=A0ABP6ZE18_9ACTN